MASESAAATELSEAVEVGESDTSSLLTELEAHRLSDPLAAASSLSPLLGLADEAALCRSSVDCRWWLLPSSPLLRPFREVSQLLSSAELNTSKPSCWRVVGVHAVRAALLLLLLLLLLLALRSILSSLHARTTPDTAQAYDYLDLNRSCLLYSRHPEHPPCTAPLSDVQLVSHISAASSLCGDGLREMAVTHLKSWMLHTPHDTPLSFFLLTDEVARQSEYVQGVVARWPRQPNITWLDLASLPDQYRAHLDDFRRCSTARIYLPLLLPAHVHQVVYLDLDSLIMNDPRPMFAHFQLFGPETLMSFAWETNRPGVWNWYHNRGPHQFPFVWPWGVNAGVMLMDVKRVQQWRWREMTYIDNMFELAERYKHKFVLGDQDWLNTLLSEVGQTTARDVWIPMPEHFNWRSMSSDVGEPVHLSAGGDSRESLVVLHGNDHAFGGKDAFSSSAYQLYLHWWGWPSDLQEGNDQSKEAG